jgi:plasmid stabilization system protein ParE
MPDLGEETKTTIRLSPEDRKNVEKIVGSGAASNTAEAIRVALAIVPVFLKTPEQVARAAREIAGAKAVTVTPTPSSGRRKQPRVARTWRFYLDGKLVDIAEEIGNRSVTLKIFDTSNDDWDPEDGPPNIHAQFNAGEWQSFIDTAAGEVEIK